MKHAVIIDCQKKAEEESAPSAMIEGICLIPGEYTDSEKKTFDSLASDWIIRRKGGSQFTADSDSGEDAYGYYCKYFDLLPENAVFRDGQLVGYYLLYGYMRYSGNGRYNFSIDDWGYPGYDRFKDYTWEQGRHLFLFDDENTHEYKEWKLMKREDGADYSEYLDF